MSGGAQDHRLAGAGVDERLEEEEEEDEEVVELHGIPLQPPVQCSVSDMMALVERLMLASVALRRRAEACEEKMAAVAETQKLWENRITQRAETLAAREVALEARERLFAARTASALAQRSALPTTSALPQRTAPSTPFQRQGSHGNRTPGRSPATRTFSASPQTSLRLANLTSPKAKERSGTAAPRAGSLHRSLSTGSTSSRSGQQQRPRRSSWQPPSSSTRPRPVPSSRPRPGSPKRVPVTPVRGGGASALNARQQTPHTAGRVSPNPRSALPAHPVGVRPGVTRTPVSVPTHRRATPTSATVPGSQAAAARSVLEKRSGHKR
eukprot:Hpha_TRINITY_DN15343_c1_g3::TRINITY_DN15343_c1_g3_i1::g.88295::m.88295